MRRISAVAAGVSALAFAASAQAQINQPTDTSGTTPTVNSPAITTPRHGETDLDLVAGHVGLRYFGVDQVATLPAMNAPMPGADANALANAAGVSLAGAGSLGVPTAGVRFWFNRRFALDVGLGLGIATGSRTTGPGQSTQPTSFGIAVTAGVPVTITAHRHINFHVAPFVSFAQGISVIDVYAMALAPTSYQLSTTVFRLGGRAAAEVHLGFLGLPQVSIEASVGLYLQYRADAATAASNGVQGSASTGQFALGTTLGHYPGGGAYSITDILSAAIAANYYF